MIVDLRNLSRERETKAHLEMLTDSARPIATEGIAGLRGLVLVAPWEPGSDPFAALAIARTELPAQLPGAPA